MTWRKNSPPVRLNCALHCTLDVVEFLEFRQVSSSANDLQLSAETQWPLQSSYTFSPVHTQTLPQLSVQKVASGFFSFQQDGRVHSLAHPPALNSPVQAGCFGPIGILLEAAVEIGGKKKKKRKEKRKILVFHRKILRTERFLRRSKQRSRWNQLRKLFLPKLPRFWESCQGRNTYHCRVPRWQSHRKSLWFQAFCF